jgi:hypothetical protein
LPGSGPAVLTLPQPLPPEALLELECSLATALRSLQRETCADSLERGQIEYASWLPLLGAAYH